VHDGVIFGLCLPLHAIVILSVLNHALRLVVHRGFRVLGLSFRPYELRLRRLLWRCYTVKILDDLVRVSVRRVL